MKLRWAVWALAFAAISVGAGSCALMSQGTTEEITVSSDPSGATVTLNNGETRVTPFSIVVPREQDLQLHFSKSGYQSADVDDNSRVEGGYLAADVIPFMIPWAIDASSGAGFAHQKTSVTAHLDPEAGARDDTATKTDLPLPHATPSAAATGTGTMN